MERRASKRTLKRVNYNEVIDDEIEIIAVVRPAKKAKKGKKRVVSDDESDEFKADLVEERDSIESGDMHPYPHSISAHSSKRLVPLLNGVLKWYDRVKTVRGMPWRKDYDATLDEDAASQRAYEVLVSEIMLQQTQVATVIPYYNAWLLKFPTIKDLAAVTDIEEVNALWKGLGYYRRASLLLQAAKKVVKDYDGKIPQDPAVLEKHVPGVGKYTAGAVTSIAYNVCAPAVDGNVQRLFSRLLALHAPPKSKQFLDVIWKAADDLVQTTTRPGDLNQAFIELGSTVCKVQSPLCDSCPFSKGCGALALMKQDETVDIEDACSLCEPFPSSSRAVTRFPMKVVRKEPRKEDSIVTVIQAHIQGERCVLMSQRGSTGLLAGLWEFPTTDVTEKVTAKLQVDVSKNTLRQKLPDVDVSSVTPQVLGNFLHVFSHIKKTYYIVTIKLEGSEFSRGKNCKWVLWDEFASMNVGVGTTKVWKLLAEAET
ncbi:hypothetical protein FRC03_006248 [Tulasnella sp. 419]|nr:hypothetical protein FRC02_009428 [Tulasnella sp. 418]KAG8960704.1 hypothetical protein FRC03_006248 [Tulasnella sp. 419]